MTNLSRQGQFWDSVTGQAQPIAEALKLIEALFPDHGIQGRDILDAGCGAGDYTAALRQADARSVTSFDVSTGSMRIAVIKSATGRFTQASLSELPYRTASFDIIWTWGVLHYVPDPLAALREIARTLRPGGSAIIHTLRRGFWSSLELTSARVLSKSPGWVQPFVLNTGERVVPLLSRLVTGRRPEDQTSKTIRQKLHERFFVPGKLHTFTLGDLASGLGASVETHEVHPPVADLFKRDMSITVLARKVS